MLKPQSLQQGLIARVKGAVPESLRQYAAHDFNRFGIEAGVAVELAAKAVLVAINPCLIADPRHFESMLALSGHGQAVSLQAIRTIGCIEALKRVSRIIPLIRVSPLEPLAEARNGALHLVGTDSGTAFRLLAPYIDALKTMGETLNVNFDDMFGEYSDLAKGVLQQSVEEAQIRVTAKVAHAKQLFAERYGDMHGEGLKTVIRAVEATYLLTAYDEMLSDCPACGHMAKLIGHHSFREWDYDSDEEGNVVSRTAIVDLYVEELRCAVCGLELQGEDELTAAGIETAIELDDVDSSDFEEKDWDDEDRIDYYLDLNDRYENRYEE
jgi:hypothetical protein